MIGSLIVSTKVLFFVGGAAAAIVGSKIAKSEKTRKFCVKTLAKGMMLQDSAKECFQNIKEEATDIYEDAKKQAAEETE
ncbi:MAG: DUF1490 domain-containing protein [Oscillospiraceae bacterium]|nr:DUF1490 domain-containing protein [Oscillospiraceae bacterium]